MRTDVDAAMNSTSVMSAGMASSSVTATVAATVATTVGVRRTGGKRGDANRRRGCESEDKFA